MFKLKCCTTWGEDEEIEIKILKVFKDHWGPYMMFKSTDGKFHDVSINQMLELRYKPNDLRALHYQISCVTLEMIELKEKVTIAMNKGENFYQKHSRRTTQNFKSSKMKKKQRRIIKRRYLKCICCSLIVNTEDSTQLKQECNS